MRKTSQIVILVATYGLAFVSVTAAAQTNFGSVKVGSSSTSKVTLKVATAGTIGSIAVVTQGSSGLDFTNAGTGTCTVGTEYAANATCTVSVKFKPAYAGTRYGAALLKDGSGDIVATGFIRGTGLGAQIAFAPCAWTLFKPTLNGEETINSTGIAVDGAGDLFIADYSNNRLVEVPAGGGATIAIAPTVNGKAVDPFGVALDGAGNLFIADYSNNRVIEVPAGGAPTAIDPIVSGEGLNGPWGVAVDGAGDLYISDSVNNRVIEVPTGGGAAIAIAPTVNGASLIYPRGLALDSSGDLFIADSSNVRVVEVPAGGGLATAIDPTVNGKTLSYPAGLAVDGLGDLFIAGPDNNNGRVIEIPAGGGEAMDIGAVVYSNLPTGIAIDRSGSIFFSGESVSELQRSKPPTLSFIGPTPVNDTSVDSPQTVQIQNIGNQALTITGLSYPTDFPEETGGTDPCNATTSLSAGQLCNLNVDFTPLSDGTFNETVTLTDNSLNVNGVHQSIAVSGSSGFPPEPMLSATSMAFGTVGYGAASPTQQVTFTNTTGKTIPGISVTVFGTDASSFVFVNPDGSYAPGCGPTQSVPPGGTCLIHGHFKPLAPGPMTAEVQIDYGGTSLLYIWVTGTGGPAPIATLATTNLSFGSLMLGTNAWQSVTLSNTGTATLKISSIGIYLRTAKGFAKDSTEFMLTDNCGSSLTAGASCTLNVNFAPTTPGSEIAAIEIKDNILVTNEQIIYLDGTGFVGETTVSLSATSLPFGTESLGSTTASKSITLTNTGSQQLFITSISETGADTSSFVMSNNCRTSLAGGASCAVHGHFTPAKAGALTAAITITTSNGSGSPQTIALSGIGGTSVSLTSKLAAFGVQEVGKATASKVIKLTNTGTIPLTISSIAVTGADASSFVFANGCGSTLAVRARCLIHGHFRPASSGALTAAVTITDNAAGSPQSISLTGTGVGPTTVSLSAASLTFASRAVGTTSATQSVTLTNTGTHPLLVTSIAVSGADASSFVFGNSCGTTVAVGASCTIHGHFTPTTTGTLTAAIKVTDSATGPPQMITLTGTGH